MKYKGKTAISPENKFYVFRGKRRDRGEIYNTTFLTNDRNIYSARQIAAEKYMRNGKFIEGRLAFVEPRGSVSCA